MASGWKRAYVAISLILVLFAAWLGMVSVSLFLLYGFPIIFGLSGAFILARQGGAGTQPLAPAVTALRLYFAAHLIWSSVRYWFFTDLQPVIPFPVAQMFLGALDAMGVFPGIKAMEGVIGLMLLANRYVPLALVLEVPTSVTIFYLNTFITGTPHTLVSGPAELLVNVLLLLGYYGYYRPFLVARAEPAPPSFREERVQA